MHKNRRLICLLSIVLVFMLSCSTKVIIVDRQKLVGKRIAIGEMFLNAKNTDTQVDTLCDCVANTIAVQMNPFFMEAGMRVIDLPVSRKHLSRERVKQLIDSLGLDYILIGSGTLNIIGKKPGKQAYFIENLSVRIIGSKNLEMIASGEFSGYGVYPQGAAKRLGNKFFTSIRKNLSK
jgi:hypothetical protein